jgi:hypothetical protein
VVDVDRSTPTFGTLLIYSCRARSRALERLEPRKPRPSRATPWLKRSKRAQKLCPEHPKPPTSRVIHRSGTSLQRSRTQFYFQTDGDNPAGKTAANLSELERELGICDSDVLRHHCPCQDFSRWITDVFHDRQLAASLAAAETQISAHSPSAVVEKGRLALIAALRARHAS